jgi:arsenite methyltransferase
MATIMTFDPKELEAKVKAMYRSVAENPKGDFHFEMGRAMAERLGYSRVDLDRIPQSRSSPLPASVITSISPT